MRGILFILGLAFHLLSLDVAEARTKRLKCNLGSVIEEYPCCSIWKQVSKAVLWRIIYPLENPHLRTSEIITYSWRGHHHFSLFIQHFGLPFALCFLKSRRFTEERPTCSQSHSSLTWAHCLHSRRYMLLRAIAWLSFSMWWLQRLLFSSRQLAIGKGWRYCKRGDWH